MATASNWARARQYLIKQKQGPYWSYQPGQMPSTETTGWCAIAFADNLDIARETTNYLVGIQNADGGFSTAPGITPSDWSTTIACLSLRTLMQSQMQLSKNAGKNDKTLNKCLFRAIDYLLNDRAEIYLGLAKAVWVLAKGSKAGNYPRGWPWTPGTYNWVEPTSYAILALLPTTLAQKDPVRMAIINGHQYLLNHACVNGGWNYGQIKSGTENVPAYQLHTAEALLALQGLKERPEVQSGLSYLRSSLKGSQSALSLSWAILALDALGQNFAAELNELAKLQKDDGSFGTSIYTSAIATIALSLSVRPSPLNFAKQPILDLS